SGTQSSGVVRILKDLDTDLHGRNVLIVEDIIDSGLTLSWLIANLKSRQPESVEICALLRKPDAARVDIDVKYLGFDIPNQF
ncbi:phosphoribosyltransferase family protein, partial [Undibacterium sp. 5I1]